MGRRGSRFQLGSWEISTLPQGAEWLFGSPDPLTNGFRRFFFRG